MIPFTPYIAELPNSKIVFDIDFGDLDIFTQNELITKITTFCLVRFGKPGKTWLCTWPEIHFIQLHFLNEEDATIFKLIFWPPEVNSLN